MGEKVDVLAVLDESAYVLSKYGEHAGLRLHAARAAVAELIEAAGAVLSTDKWWRNNADSPKSALDHYMDASDHLRAALARIGAA